MVVLLLLWFLAEVKGEEMEQSRAACTAETAKSQERKKKKGMNELVTTIGGGLAD